MWLANGKRGLEKLGSGNQLLIKQIIVPHVRAALLTERISGKQ